MTTKLLVSAYSGKQKLILYLVIGLLAFSTLGMMTLIQTPDVATHLFASDQCQHHELPQTNPVDDVTAVPSCWLVR